MLLRVIILFLFTSQCFCCFSQNRFIPEYNDGSKITIPIADSVIVFSTLNKSETIKAKPRITYYYLYNNQVRNSQGGYTGKLLNGKWTKNYRNGQLIVQGAFKNGTKHGKWIVWYSSGKIKEKCQWRKGKKKGRKYVYTENGNIAEKYIVKKKEWELVPKIKKKNKKKRNADLNLNNTNNDLTIGNIMPKNSQADKSKKQAATKNKNKKSKKIFNFLNFTKKKKREK